MASTTFSESTKPAGGDSRPNSDPAQAAKAFRETIQAFGPEKLAKIRSQITSIPKIATLPTRSRPSIPMPTIPSSSSSSGQTHLLPIAPPTKRKGSTSKPPTPPPPPPPPAPADKKSAYEDDVDLTIQLLETALGKEDMEDLMTAMQSVRRKSMAEVLISSEMSPEEIAHNVELVKARQELVLGLLFDEILELVEAKLGIIEARDPGSRRWKDWKWEEEWGGSVDSGSTVVEGEVTKVAKRRAGRRERGGLEAIVNGGEYAEGDQMSPGTSIKGDTRPTTPKPVVVNVDPENTLKVPSPEELAARKKKAQQAAAAQKAANGNGNGNGGNGDVKVIRMKGKKERSWSRRCMCCIM